MLQKQLFTRFHADVVDKTNSPYSDIILHLFAFYSNACAGSGTLAAAAAVVVVVVASSVVVVEPPVRFSRQTNDFESSFQPNNNGGDIGYRAMYDRELTDGFC